MPLYRDDHMLPQWTLLRGHTSPETAFVQEDYPYGRRLRCKRRIWVETATKGAQRGKQRFVYQTTNPKRADEPWNTPHADQYRYIVYLFVDHSDDDHVKHFGLSDWGPPPDTHAKFILTGLYGQMTDDERKVHDALVARNRKSIPETWDRFDRLVALTRRYIDEHDALPERDERSCLVFGDERFHQYDSEWQVTVAAALTGGTDHLDEPDEYAEVAALLEEIGVA